MSADRISQQLDVSADVVLLTVHESELHVALFLRDRDPELGRWALPGGYVHPDEDNSVADAAARVLLQKTNIRIPYLEQLHTFSGPLRDRRGWSISVAHYALVADQVLADAAPEAMRLVSASAIPALPFDHNAIVDTALARVRSKSSYSSLPALLMPEEFTLPQLHGVYQAVLGEDLNMASFRRKMLELDILEAIKGGVHQVGKMRPAQLYRLRQQFRKSLVMRDRSLISG